MSGPRCGTCTFYRPPELGKGPGECRRRSPHTSHDVRTGAWRAFWPWVWGERDWCGDWRPRDDEPLPIEEPTHD